MKTFSEVRVSYSNSVNKQEKAEEWTREVKTKYQARGKGCEVRGGQQGLLEMRSL